MTANKSSFWAILFQAAVGTSQITAVDTPCYSLGNYSEEMKEFKPPTTTQPVEEYHNYGSREGAYTKLDKTHDNFKLEYEPVDASFLGRFLGKCVDAEPITMEALDTGMKYPSTVRHQKDEGTVPQNKQAVDAYSVSLSMMCNYNKNLKVQEEFAYGILEDIADNPNLTTMPLVSAGCEVTGAYNGTPYFTWNVTHRPEVTNVTFKCDQVYKKSHDPTTGKDTTHLYEYKDRSLTAIGIFETEADSNIMWTDYKAGTPRTCKVKLYKPDGATYIEITFTNCLITSFPETGIRDEGHYSAVVTIRLGPMTVAATRGSITFGNHYKVGAL